MVEHLNADERKLLSGTSSEFLDIFYLKGDKLNSTEAAQHSIRVEAGTEPINTRPYRLPESQRDEVNEHVQNLLKDRIIESESPWNSQILIVPKKANATGQQKFRLVCNHMSVIN
jgi:hypothetical protein